jgi:hypothetical protein
MAQTRIKNTNAWLLALEAERLDISYRRNQPTNRSVRQILKDLEKPVPAPNPQNDQRTALERIKRDRLYYDAGRFAAGARDAEAVAAFAELNGRKNA